MRDYVILSDSCCDLDADLRKKYGIEYIPMRIIFGDTDIPASLDWEKISPKEFYDMMRGGVRVRTAQINADDSKRRFRSISTRARTLCISPVRPPFQIHTRAV